jgi:hypothetical protein
MAGLHMVIGNSIFGMYKLLNDAWRRNPVYRHKLREHGNF